MSAACFVRDLTDGAYVNLARAASIKAMPDDRNPGQWVVLAYFSGRTLVVGRAGSEAEANAMACQLATNANNGAAA